MPPASAIRPPKRVDPERRCRQRPDTDPEIGVVSLWRGCFGPRPEGRWRPPPWLFRPAPRRELAFAADVACGSTSIRGSWSCRFGVASSTGPEGSASVAVRTLRPAPRRALASAADVASDPTPTRTSPDRCRVTRRGAFGLTRRSDVRHRPACFGPRSEERRRPRPMSPAARCQSEDRYRVAWRGSFSLRPRGAAGIHRRWLLPPAPGGVGVHGRMSPAVRRRPVSGPIPSRLGWLLRPTPRRELASTAVAASAGPPKRTGVHRLSPAARPTPGGIRRVASAWLLRPASRGKLASAAWLLRPASRRKLASTAVGCSGRHPEGR